MSNPFEKKKQLKKKKNKWVNIVISFLSFIFSGMIFVFFSTSIKVITLYLSKIACKKWEISIIFWVEDRSSSFGSLYVKKIFEFAEISGFFLEPRFSVLDLLDKWWRFLDFLNPHFDMVMVLINFVFNIIKVLNDSFAFLGHLLYALNDWWLLLKINLLQVNQNFGCLLVKKRGLILGLLDGSISFLQIGR